MRPGSDWDLAWFISAWRHFCVYVFFVSVFLFVVFLPLSSHPCSPSAGRSSLPGCVSALWRGLTGRRLGAPPPTHRPASPRVQTPPGLPSPPPQRTAYVCRLLTRNFSVFLFCSSVLHLHPCRYCSFVLSPQPPPSRTPPTRPARLCVVYLPYVGPAVSPKANPHHETAQRQFHEALKKNKNKERQISPEKTPKSAVAHELLVL